MAKTLVALLAPTCAASRRTNSQLENELLAVGAERQKHLIDLGHGQKKNSSQACKEKRDAKALVVKKESSCKEKGCC